MQIANKTILITGARKPFTHSDSRVVPLIFDLTSAALIQGAAATVGSLDILINNAGIALYDDLSDSAALFSLTQSQRALLTGRGVTVHAAMIGPTDTEMNRGLDIPKNAPESTANGIFDGVEKQQEEIFPDPMSALMAESWNGSAAKAMERQNAALIAAVLA
jgi:NAD(P)-dependent dehydrogenase (short-subunit alcohol dehydrogenase family)